MIAVIDYKAGNLRSVERALKKLNVPCLVTKDRNKIAQADRIVFPGVGAAGKAMAELKELGAGEALRSAFLKGTPILGICLGAQVILEESDENKTPCLGLLRGKVKRFPDELYEEGNRLKIPHMGWNRIDPVRRHPVLEGIQEGDEFYFVHSYYPSPDDGSMRDRRDLLRHPFSLGDRVPEPVRDSVPSGKERPGRIADPEEFLRVGRRMLSRRIIPCLDVRSGKTTKGIKFKENTDIGDPVEMAKFYYEQGADEIVFYDITASSDKRDIMIEVVERVADEISIPFSVGGGIRTLEDMRRVLLAGAEKVSVNSAAVKNPRIIADGAKAFGNQCIVLGMDVKRVNPSGKIPSGYEVVIDGGRSRDGDRRPLVGPGRGAPRGGRDLPQFDRCRRDPGGIRTETDTAHFRERGDPRDRIGRGREHRPRL